MQRFLGKVLLFVILMFPLLWIKTYVEVNFLFPELKKLNSALENHTGIIMFGSSVNKHLAKSDSDKRAIDQFLDAELATEKVVGISHFAYNATIFYSFLKYMTKKENIPAVVIPINMRSFSPEWDLRPNYQFVKEKNLLEFNIFWNFYSNYEEVGEIEFMNTAVFNYDGIAEKVEDYIRLTNDTLAEQKKGFIFHYMQPITESHRNLKALEAIARLAREKNLKVYFYITPIDFERTRQLEMFDFDAMLIANCNKIKSSLNKEGYKVLDLSHLLGHRYFDYQLRPNEHINMYGRQLIAKEIAAHINENRFK